jgi:tight adherence protein B
VKRFAAAGLALAFVGVLAGGALAQEGGDRLLLRIADARDPEAVHLVVSYGGAAGDLDDMAVTVDGQQVDAVPATLESLSITNDIVFVVDSSASTDTDGLLTEAKQAIGDFVEELPPDTRASIITATAVGQTIQRLTADSAELTDAVTALTPDGQGGMNAAIVLAAGQLGDAVDDGSVGTIVVFTDGAPEESVELDVAKTEVIESGAVLDTIALSADGYDESPFETLTGVSSGRYQVVEDASDIQGAFADLQPELTQIGAVTYPAVNATGVEDVTVAVGDSSASGSYVAGGQLVGPARLAPRPPVEPTGPSFLRGDAGQYLAYGLVLVSAILLAYGIALIIVREDNGLDDALQPYAEGFVADGDRIEDDEGSNALAQTALLKRAVEATEHFADQQGFLTRVERTLEKADIPLRAGEAMFFYMAAVLLVLVLTLTLFSNPLGALISTALVALIAPAVVNFRASRKKKKFESLLPDTLQLLSSTLRAGYSMMQGVEAVSQEAEEPMGKELRRVVTEARLGRPLEESLDGVADRMESGDFNWAVMAIRIQREVGGNLSELLLTVAETMTQRERLRRDISALTAEGRISAYVLGFLPIGLGAAIYTINPDYMGQLFDEPVGNLMLGAAVLAMLAGFAWMFKIIKIEL